ncbi:hypothetical protein OZY43_03205 [Lactobacillus sp. ESL0785]|uniref:hypothetical protein n=1 Tax=Lactobacillus sp. ESL0785 TaxID=2983232 RepID=UPI0023F6958D|nr:hypothetical protein [Lactobacillus sp. ESL0785]WEV71423.1 hypothetical protein OZY43_03205 [Lactobacillus sp. ESL0785]
MKKVSTVLSRILMVLLVAGSGFLLLRSSVTVNVPDTHKVVREVINKSAASSTDSSLKTSLKIAQKWGLEDKILAPLPQKYHYDLSYTSLYNLSAAYQANGELTAENLNLPTDNQTERAVNYLILKQLNENLNENSKQVGQLISIFQCFILAVLLVFILAALLILFGKYGASAAVLLASIGTFGALQYCSTQLVQILQSELAKGISFVILPQLWWGLAIGIFVAIVWPLCLRITKK